MPVSKWDGRRLKIFRADYNLSQRDVSILLGARQQTVSEWELGLYTPRRAYNKLLDHCSEEIAKIWKDTGNCKEEERDKKFKQNLERFLTKEKSLYGSK